MAWSSAMVVETGGGPRIARFERFGFLERTTSVFAALAGLRALPPLPMQSALPVLASAGFRTTL
jgi:hypothetical protein